MRVVGMALALSACTTGSGPGGAGPLSDLATAPDLVCTPRLDGEYGRDPMNCGGCGACPFGIDRRGGNAYQFHCCAGRCVDAQVDPRHCGTCDIDCPGEQTCSDWMCR